MLMGIKEGCTYLRFNVLFPNIIFRCKKYYVGNFGIYIAETTEVKQDLFSFFNMDMF